MSAANIDRAIKAIEEVVQAALNGQAGMGTLRPDWILERLFPLLADLAQEHSDAMELRLENDGLRRDREALALGGIPAPVSELAALRERIRLLEKMAMAEFLRAELYHSHLEDGCVMGPGVIAATEEARRVRIQDVVDDAHLLPDV